ncbi:MAG: dUTP diphosphatase, partial [Patescibacteria group bacterium]
SFSGSGVTPGNTSDADYIFEAGQKIAQMIIQKVEHPEFIEVSELDSTERGNGAFGSTGVY